MYRVLTSLWSRSPTSNNNNNIRLSSVNSSDLSIDEDDWVLVSDNVSKITSSNDSNSIMTNSWIASPPLMKTDESSFINRSSSPTTHHFNPIENLLIEHASMSVYEQIASRTRSKRHRKTVNDNLLDEQVEEVKHDGGGGGDDDDEDRSSVVLQYSSQHPNLSSIHHRNLNASLCHSTNSSTSTLESSTSSLMAHQRHLHRIHQQRRRRSAKTSSKLILTNNIDETTKQTSNKIIERQRLNYARTPKLILHQPSRSNH
ncbi:unnamed protein product [Rotaria sordida]|uniref:Uncharacterized protein n=1 Tax=Rotaria sordida TaxID=392033 RepID=A0A813TEB4_9BILA|nr:unnamed protein product [Rotaria sordida]CAF0765906.1 unnamed protein product [Rotaria sordida]CAF0802938.1 unnamed protein product [Rotaria sordida]CAF0804124.1 unnamed protein product [Rotaria sordida]CAF0809638.1 unnamed protein product [Rotaria sordida]